MRFPALSFRLYAAVFLATALLTPVRAEASGADIGAMFFNLIASAMPLWIPVAVLVIVVAGVTLIFATQEGGIAKARSTIIAVVVGGVIIMIAASGVLLTTFWQGAGYNHEVIQDRSLLLTAESLGLVGWLSAMAGMIGLLFIIISAIKAVASFGQDEDSYNKVRIALLHVIIGLIVIAAGGLISNSITAGNPNPLMDLILSKIQTLLFVITAVALLMLVYAGFRMITNFGQEEVYTSAKSLAIRVVFGLAVIMVSYIVTFFVSQMFNSGAAFGGFGPP